MKHVNLNIAIRRMAFFLLFGSTIMQGCKQKPKDESNQMTEDDTAMEAADTSEEGAWIVLFDGTSTDQWRGYLKDSFPEAGWVIEDGALRCVGREEGEESHGGGDIITQEKFDNFELEMEWKISKGGNSGILFMGQEIEGEPIWHTAPEMQILDNANHPDAKMGINGNRKAGSLYDLIPADPQNANPFGEWNKVRILKDDRNVTFFMNDEQVVQFELWTDEWNKLVANSKFADMEQFAKESEGYIGLQDHGNDVWFRNIRIKRL